MLSRGSPTILELSLSITACFNIINSLLQSLLAAPISSLLSFIEIIYLFVNLLLYSHYTAGQFILRLCTSLIIMGISKVAGDDYQKTLISKKMKRTHVKSSLLICLSLALVFCEFSYLDNIKWSELVYEVREKIILELMVECLWRFMTLDFVANRFLVRFLQTLLSIKVLSAITGTDRNLATRLRLAFGCILMCLALLGIQKLKDVLKLLQLESNQRSSKTIQSNKKSRKSPNRSFEERKETEEFSARSSEIQEVYRTTTKKNSILLNQNQPSSSQKSFKESDKLDNITLIKMLNCLPEGIIALDLNGKVRFMNKYTKNIFEFEEEATLGELSQSLIDFKFREASIHMNNMFTLSKESSSVRKSLFNTSIDDYSPRLSRSELHKIKGLSSLKSLFTLCLNDPEVQEATELFGPTFQTRYHHQHTDVYYSIEIKVHLLAESSYEKYFVILLRDITEREHKFNSLEKEKIVYRDNLIASFSHELRTPLNANLAFLEQSLESPEIPEKEKNSLLKPAFDSGRLLFYMVSDILDYSLLIVDKLQLEVKPRNLIQTVEQCSNLFQIKAAQKGLDLKIKIEGIIPSLFYTDHQRMSQVLTNLLNNAMQFTTRGKIEIRISRNSNSSALITVRDTGIGMEQNTQDKLERKLTKEILKEKLSESSVGIGLGLYISNKLAKILGTGEQKGIGFLSKLGVGSEFFFEIENKEPKDWRKSFKITNRGVSSPETDEGCDLTNRLKGYNSYSMKNLFHMPRKVLSEGAAVKALIVDDEIFNIIVIENYCKSLGIATEKAFNGKEAINKLQIAARDNEVPIKIIFMDINMPVMDGYEATRNIFEMVDRKEIEEVAIVGATAYVSVDMIEKCHQYGMSEVMNKPISKERITQVLKKYKILDTS